MFSYVHDALQGFVVISRKKDKKFLYQPRESVYSSDSESKTQASNSSSNSISFTQRHTARPGVLLQHRDNCSTAEADTSFGYAREDWHQP